VGRCLSRPISLPEITTTRSKPDDQQTLFDQPHASEPSRQGGRQSRDGQRRLPDDGGGRARAPARVESDQGGQGRESDRRRHRRDRGEVGPALAEATGSPGVIRPLGRLSGRGGGGCRCGSTGPIQGHLRNGPELGHALTID